MCYRHVLQTCAYRTPCRNMHRTEPQDKDVGNWSWGLCMSLVVNRPRQVLNSFSAAIDMCMDMCIDMCLNVCIDMCTGMRIEMSIHMLHGYV